MKSPLLILIALLLLGASSRSDELGGNGPVIGGGNPPPTATNGTCVEVEIGGEKTQKLDCINQQLKLQAERVRPVGNVPPLDAASPAVALHGFNETALQQQYGQNLGKSVVPFRPTKP